jgi:hypothetical protein
VRVRILAKFWRFLRVPACELSKGADGECDDPSTPGKCIKVWDKLSGERELEVTIHELLHAADWHKDETWVRSVAADATRVLWRLGYRRGA